MISLCSSTNIQDYDVLFLIPKVCDKIELFHKSLSNDGLVAFHYRSYGTFLYLKTQAKFSSLSFMCYYTQSGYEGSGCRGSQKLTGSLVSVITLSIF